jgi:hypothetical protein
VVSAFVAGISDVAGAEELKDTEARPPIFAHPLSKKPDPAPKPSAAAPAASNPESAPAMSRLISDGLPKFDSKLMDDAPGPNGNSPAAGLTEPVLMEPFTVFDERVRDLVAPQESLMEKVSGTDPLLRHVGRRLTTELSFVNLDVAYNWKPFEPLPPPAVTLRLTISW